MVQVFILLMWEDLHVVTQLLSGLTQPLFSNACGVSANKEGSLFRSLFPPFPIIKYVHPFKLTFYNLKIKTIY